MRQRLFITLASVSLSVGLVAAPALAVGGGPARYQVATTSYSVAVLDAFIHTFIVVANPCDGSIAITGSTPIDSGYYTTETVTGTQAGGVITFSSTYDGPYNPGFMWSGSFPVGGGALSGDYTGTVTAAPSTMTSFKNHGDYVSSMGGGPDAAHSCIGMPITHDEGASSDGDGPNHGQDVAAAHRNAHATKHLLDLAAEGPDLSGPSTKTGTDPKDHSNQGHSNNGHSNNGHSNNGHSNNGHSNNGHSNNGHHGHHGQG